MLLRMAEWFYMFSLKRRMKTPLALLSLWLPGRTRADLKALSLCNRGESVLKGQHTDAGSLSCLACVSVTEMAWEDSHTPPPNPTPVQGTAGPNLLLGQERPRAGGQAWISSQPRQMGSLWLQLNQALLRPQAEDPVMSENWRDKGRSFHGVLVWNNLSLTSIPMWTN